MTNPPGKEQTWKGSAPSHSWNSDLIAEDRIIAYLSCPGQNWPTVGHVARQVEKPSPGFRQLGSDGQRIPPRGSGGPRLLDVGNGNMLMGQVT